jgi:glycopeptide antibiotics resistance protein
MRKIDVIIFIFFLVVTSIGLLIKKYFQFDDNITLFIKDSLGNIGGAIVGSFFFFSWSKESKFIKREIIIISVCLGLIIYEFIQLILPWQTFDTKDLLGTALGGIIASIINALIFIPSVLKSQVR